MLELLDYKWIIVMSGFMAFFTAWGIGANDVANAFGTSVGSKTLTIKQALLIAAVFEFIGAFFLGSTVTDTISSKIANLQSFANRPELFMYGMLCTDLASGLWILLATHLELPVSTTHSTIGGIIGFSLVNGGASSVKWVDPVPYFPYMEGVVPIVISWFISPLLAAAFAMSMFYMVRTLILRRRNSLHLGYFLVPFIFWSVVMINVVFILSKGSKFLLDQQSFPYKNQCALDLRKEWHLSTDTYEITTNKVTGVTSSIPVFAFNNYPPRFDGTDKIYSTRDDWKMDTNSYKPFVSEVAYIWKTEQERRCKHPDMLRSHCVLQEATWKDPYVKKDLQTKEWKYLDLSKERSFPYPWITTSSGAPITSIQDRAYGNHGSIATISHWNYEGTTIGDTELPCPFMKPYDEDEYFTGRFSSGAEAYCCRKETIWKHNGLSSVEGCAAIVASGVMFLSYLYFYLYLKPRLHRMVDDPQISDLSHIMDPKKSPEEIEDIEQEVPPKKSITTFLERAGKKIFQGFHADIHTTVQEGSKDYDHHVASMHQFAEKFDPYTEKLFEYVQVFSACAMSFAHGANDVANAIGPFAGAWYAYKLGLVMPKAPQLDQDMKWILGLGGAGIVLGLATYGHVIMRGLGVKLAKITPSRGFCMETASSLTVTFASAYGLPVSTTHCQVGATAGVGILEHRTKGVNWKYLGKSFSGWVATLFITGLLSAAFYSQGTYAPNIYGIQDRELIQQAVGNHVFQSLNMIKLQYPSYYSTNKIEIDALDTDNKLLHLYQFKGNTDDSRIIPEITCRKNKIYNPLKKSDPAYMATKIGTEKYVPQICNYAVQSPCLYYEETDPAHITCKEVWGDSTYSYFQNIQYIQAEDIKDILDRLKGTMADAMGYKHTPEVYELHP
jgi:phosphate/sulfate permease